tara:strand:- start:48 stop:569 length:522 start_codon:yes stop_codon:yes gene_type:complete
MKTKQTISWLIALMFALGPLIGCGLVNPYKRNSEGYYEKHFNCCGPIALEKAFNKLNDQHGIISNSSINRKSLSKEIQDMGVDLKNFLSFFNREAICITWPSEMKAMARKYGFEPITIKDIDTLDPEKDVALVLIHKSITDFHWVVFPMDNPKTYYGKENTVIDKIYLLKKIN